MQINEQEELTEFSNDNGRKLGYIVAGNDIIPGGTVLESTLGIFGGWSTATRCQLLCNDTSDCAAWTKSGDRCWLKNKNALNKDGGIDVVENNKWLSGKKL